MAKGKRRNNRRRGDDSSSDDEVRADVAEESLKKGGQSENFRDRRELQRKQAAEKRRLKQRCFACGKTGHVRRSCPGVEDDGRGESKYTKSKGDQGAVTLKANGKGKGRKKQNGATSTILTLNTPSGFESVSAAPLENEQADELKESFVYFDSMCDGAATLQYLQNGRSGAMFQKTKDEAVHEFQTAINNSRETSNFGGCLAQVYVKLNQLWTSETSVPLPWWEEADEENLPSPYSFVIGLNNKLDCVHDAESARSVLLSACDDQRVVGLCAKLDYSDLRKFAMDREAQLARVNCACGIALEVRLPLQLQILPGATEHAHQSEEDDSLYYMVLHDLRIILERPENADLKVHLNSWIGMASDMTSLLQKFPDTLWVGMDGSVSFSKAVQAHECAFDVPLDRLLLETGNNIPASVASVLGRQAFPHSGLIPHVAVAVAEHKKHVSPHEVARQASSNTVQLYTRINVLRDAKHSKPFNNLSMT